MLKEVRGKARRQRRALSLTLLSRGSMSSVIFANDNNFKFELKTLLKCAKTANARNTPPNLQKQHTKIKATQ